MITLIDNMDLMSLLSKLATDNCTRETSAYDQYFFLFICCLFYYPRIARRTL